MNPWKLVMQEQIQNQLSITAIVLLAPTRPPADLDRVTQPDFVAKFFEHLFKPGAITTGFQGD